jgi:hypothetical protein
MTCRNRFLWQSVSHHPAGRPGLAEARTGWSGVNGDLQQAVTQQSARDKAQLKHAAIGHMRKGSNSPDLVRSFFGHKTFRYAT